MPAKVVVIGYGNVGGAAARMAIGLGANVTVLGTDLCGLRKFQASVGPNVQCLLNNPETLAEEIRDADLVIGAILISTYSTSPMIDSDLLRTTKKGSILIDLTVGYGEGYLPTFTRQTTHDNPVDIIDGVLHCKIDSIPSSVPVSASQASSFNVVPYIDALGPERSD